MTHSNGSLPALPGDQTKGPVSPVSRPATEVLPAEDATFHQYRTAGRGADADWRRYLAVIRRRWWLILILTVVGTGIGLAAATMARPTYETEVRLWVEGPASSQGGSGPLTTEGFLQSYDWVDLLRSYAVLEPVTRERGLVVRPASASHRPAFAGFRVGESFTPGSYELRVSERGTEYTLVHGDSLVVEQGAVGSPIGGPLGFEWSPASQVLTAGNSIHFEVVPAREAARDLGEDMEVRMLEEGSFIHLTLRGKDPDRVAAVLNDVADRFVEVAADLRAGRSQEMEGRIAAQFASAEEELRSAEGALEAFRERTATRPMNAVAGGQMTPLQTSYFDVLYQFDRTRRDREALDQLLASDVESDALAVLLEGVPIVAESPQFLGTLEEVAAARQELEVARRSYTDLHPEVQALQAELDRLEAGVPAMAERFAEALAGQERLLASALSDRSTELGEIPSLVTEQAMLERRVALTSEMYALLRQRHEAARLAVAGAVPEVRILDRAEAPLLPMTDIRNRIVLFAFAGSLGLALFGALLRDRWDPSIRYPEELTSDMGLAMLGTIPRLKLEHGTQRNGAAAEEATEAFRGLRLNLSYAYGSSGPIAAAVTSAGPGDGKSFVALNLALGYARIGMRTLLVDGDVRRGRLHRVLGVSRRPGLVDLLAGEASTGDVIAPTSFAGLDLIPSGMRRKDAPELLSAPALGDLLAEMRGRYDVVLVDTAPLGAGIDPYIFSALTGNLLLVVRPGSTLRDFAWAKLSHFSRFPVRVLGAVMNAVPRSSSYPYFYYYYPEYAPEEEKVLQG